MKINLKKINPTFLAIAGLFILVVGGGFTIIHNKSVDSSADNSEAIVTESSTTIAATQPVVSDMDAFAKCITEKGAKLYGASWCPHCQIQKKEFGESVQYVNYIECAVEGSKNQAEACAAAGIKGYPTWQFADGSQILGEATFEQLSEKTSCPL